MIRYLLIGTNNDINGWWNFILSHNIHYLFPPKANVNRLMLCKLARIYWTIGLCLLRKWFISSVPKHYTSHILYNIYYQQKPSRQFLAGVGSAEGTSRFIHVYTTTFVAELETPGGEGKNIYLTFSNFSGVFQMFFYRQKAQK